MITQQNIPCPVCQTAIPFDATQLLQGVGFSCPQCGSVVSMAPESIPQGKAAIAEFQKFKISQQNAKEASKQ